MVKTLMIGKIEVRRKRGQQRIRWLEGITNSMDMSLGKLQEMVKDSLVCCSPWIAELDMTVTEQQQHRYLNVVMIFAHFFFLEYEISTRLEPLSVVILVFNEDHAIINTKQTFV